MRVPATRPRGTGPAGPRRPCVRHGGTASSPNPAAATTPYPASRPAVNDPLRWASDPAETLGASEHPVPLDDRRRRDTSRAAAWRRPLVLTSSAVPVSTRADEERLVQLRRRGELGAASRAGRGSASRSRGGRSCRTGPDRIAREDLVEVRRDDLGERPAGDPRRDPRRVERRVRRRRGRCRSRSRRRAARDGRGSSAS